MPVFQVVLAIQSKDGARRQLRVVRGSLLPGVLRSIRNAFASCHLDYCNSLIAGFPLCDIKLLQMVQNAAALLFGGVSRQ